MGKRSKRTRGRGRAGGIRASTSRPAAGDLRPDDLVFGNADQLRAMAATLERGDQTSTARLARASTSRVKAYRQRHPDADLDSLVGRPVCETAVDDPAPQARTGRIVSNAADTNAPRVDIWIDGYITSMAWFSDEISAGMLREELAAAGGRDVRVHFNSGGGDYFEGVAMYSALSDYAGDVYCAVDAFAASAASMVAMAGDTVGIALGAFLMIHDASTFCFGNAADLVAAATMLDAVSAEMAEVYAQRAGGSAEEWRTAMKAETWYGPAAAVSAGLADERIDSDSAPSADPAQPSGDDEDDDEEPVYPVPSPEDALDRVVTALTDRLAARLAPQQPGPGPPAAPAPAATSDTADLFVRRLMGA